MMTFRKLSAAYRAQQESFSRVAATLAESVSVFKLDDKNSAPVKKAPPPGAQIRAMAKPVARPLASQPKRLAVASAHNSGDWEQF